MTSLRSRLVEAASGVTGMRFRALAASSMIASSAIIGSALAGDDSGWLAALLSRAQGEAVSPAVAAAGGAPSLGLRDPAACRTLRVGAGRGRRAVAGRTRTDPRFTCDDDARDDHADDPDRAHRAGAAGGRDGADQARVRDLAREPGLRAVVRRELADAVPQRDAATAGRAADRVLAAQRRRPAEPARNGQRSAAERVDAGGVRRLQELRGRGRARQERRRPGRRLHLPGPGADHRRSGRGRRANLARVRRGDGGQVRRRQLRPSGLRRRRRPRARRLRGGSQPVRLLPLAVGPRRLLGQRLFRSTPWRRT